MDGFIFSKKLNYDSLWNLNLFGNEIWIIFYFFIYLFFFYIIMHCGLWTCFLSVKTFTRKNFDTADNLFCTHPEVDALNICGKLRYTLLNRNAIFFNIPRYNRTRDTNRRDIDFFSLEIKQIIPAYKYNVSLNTFCSLIKHNKEINLEIRTPLFLNQYVGLITYLSAIDWVKIPLIHMISQ